MTHTVRHGSGTPLGIPVYALGTNPAERERLRRQAEELRDHSAALLDQVGVEPGWSTIDLGCGPRGIVDLLADRVGPEGRVVGLDYNPDSIALAREFAVANRLTNATFVVGDARSTGLPDSSFDLVHTRTLLINVPEPADVVAEMTRLARPGGWVAAMEPDVVLSLCYPPHPSWDRLAEIFMQVQDGDGADPHVGRRLPALLQEAGLVDVGVEARADVYPVGHSRRTVRVDLMRSMRPKIVERGLATERELDELDRAAREHLDDPDTLVMPHLLVLAWGRKPG